MSTNSTLNNKKNSSLIGGDGSSKLTYGSYVSGGVSPSSAPTPVTLSSPSLEGQSLKSPALLSPVGNTLQMPNMNYNSNVVQVGASQGGGNGGVTDEGVVIGGGANPLPQINQDSSSGSGSSGSSSTPTYGNWLQNPTNNQNISGSSGQSSENTPLSAGTGVSETGAATEQKDYDGTLADSEPIDSYEDFLRNKAYGAIRDQQTQFYDEQSQKALAAIEAQHQAALAEAEKQKTMADSAATEQKDAALAEAEKQKNLLINMSKEQKNAVYKFAEEQRISDMNYAAQQYQLLLDSINAQKESGMAMATEQRDLLLSMSEEQRQAAYKYAEEQRASATTHANSQYQTLVDAINAQKESGMAMAEEQRQLLLSMSEEQRNAIYAAAESQRVAAEHRADVERERGVVDARSSYEQNKASYGANAEAMGSMGLSGSGYSDYLNSRAYAQQRAETQAANAQADASKREARYTEDQARLQADSDYYQNKYNAEQAYSDRKYQIDTTYQTNMLNAEQGKAQSIYEAESAERDAKYSADSAHAQNQYNAEAQYSQNKYDVDTTYQTNLLGANQSKAQAEHEATSAERESKFNADQAHGQNEYAAEAGYSQSKYEAESAERDAKLQSGLSYSENLFNAESQARSDKLATEQTADAGKLSAEMSYQENILKDSENARAAYTELLSGANSGDYSVEQLEHLSSEYGLTDKQKQSLINAANDYTTKKQAATNAEVAAGLGDTMGAIDSAQQSGSISEEQASAQKAQIQRQNYESYSSELSYGNADTSAIDRAYQRGEISETQYNSLKSQWNDNIDTSADFFYANNTMLTKSAARKALDNLSKNTWCDESTKKALEAEFDKLYTPKIGGTNYNASDNELGDEGNNFKVEYNGVTYRVESAGECTDTNVKEVASDVSNGSMFGYQGHVYIKSNGKIYEIRNRKNSYQDDWDTIYAALCG